MAGSTESVVIGSLLLSGLVSRFRRRLEPRHRRKNRVPGQRQQKLHLRRWYWTTVSERGAIDDFVMAVTAAAAGPLSESAPMVRCGGGARTHSFVRRTARREKERFSCSATNSAPSQNCSRAAFRWLWRRTRREPEAGARACCT